MLIHGSVLGPLRAKTGDVVWEMRNLVVLVSPAEESVDPLRTGGSVSADLEVMRGVVKGCERCTGLASPIFVQSRVCAEFTEIQTWIVLELSELWRSHKEFQFILSSFYKTGSFHC